MILNNDSKTAILFVDDEEQTLKYFDKLFSKQYQIYSAPSVQSAKEILEKHPVDIVITDQRMPAETGVELLEYLRNHYPNIIRLITTAYAELDNAVKSINEGGVFWYIHKPWKIAELGAVLKRAERYSQLQTEYNLLMEEKISVLQHALIVDRIRGLLLLAESLETCLEAPSLGLLNYAENLQKACPLPIRAEDVLGTNIEEIAKSESSFLLDYFQTIQNFINLADEQPENQASVAELLEQSLAAFKEEPEFKQINLTSQIASDSGTVSGKTDLLKEMFHILLTRLAMTAKTETQISITSDQHAIRITSPNQTWNDQNYASLFSAGITSRSAEMGQEMDLLTAYFIAAHFGITMSCMKDSSHGAGFELSFTSSPQQPPNQDQLFDLLYQHMTSSILSSH